jgi:hypothetical protein
VLAVFRATLTVLLSVSVFWSGARALLHRLPIVRRMNFNGALFDVSKWRP